MVHVQVDLQVAGQAGAVAQGLLGSLVVVDDDNPAARQDVQDAHVHAQLETASSLGSPMHYGC